MAKRTHPGPVAEGSLSTLTPAREMETRTIARELIHPDPSQPRKTVDLELQADLRVRGQLDPITVRQHPEILGEWMLVNGERRWRSAEGVLSTLRCQIDESDESPASRLAKQLSHNLGKPLEPLDEARAFKQIADDTGMGVADLADFLGRPKSTVGDRLALLDLGPWLELVESGEMPLSHAVKVLVPLRTAADSSHEHAIKLLRNDYRFSKKGKGEGISLGDFEHLVRQFYTPYMYPLTKTKATYNKQPEIAPSILAKHDAECDCGGIMFELGQTARKCCGNPGWWRPLHKAAIKAKPKDKSKGRQASVSKVLHLPEGVPLLKSHYGQTPEGVLQLTDSDGRWNVGTGHHSGGTFDPAELELEQKKLVQWLGYGGEYPRVGTKDTAAVKRAIASWQRRYEEQYQELLASLQLTLKTVARQYAVTGKGTRFVTQLILSEQACKLAIDVAQAFGHKLPAAVLGENNFQRVKPLFQWLTDLEQEKLEQLLTGCAAVIGEKLKLPSEVVAAAQERALDAIRKREIPWKKKPKEEPAPKSAGKKVPGKRQPNSEFTKDMYASPALAAIVGAAGMPRTDITTKLWAYIKKHKLQDKKNKRMINADAKLRPIFGGKAQVSIFDQTKLVNKHLAGTAEAAALIGTSKKAEKKSDRPATEPSASSSSRAALGTPARTAPLPGIIDDEDESDDDAVHVEQEREAIAAHDDEMDGVTDSDEQELWEGEDEEELEGVEA